MKRLLLTLALSAVMASPAHAASGGQKLPKEVPWAFEGMTGTFDRPAIQRGFQVYKEVCSSCHGLNRVAYRNLLEVGFTEDEVKAIAAEKSVMDGPDDAGDMFERPAKLSDRFVSPFPNEKAARASNGGAYPPDLSLMVKARLDGANYIYSILTGYTETPPADFHLNAGMNYNPYFPGEQIAMPSPLTSEGLVEYQDGTPATIDQMAKDVVNFLQWAAEPEMEERKQMGIRALIFLCFFTIMFYAAKRKIWSRAEQDAQ